MGVVNSAATKPQLHGESRRWNRRMWAERELPFVRTVRQLNVVEHQPLFEAGSGGAQASAVRRSDRL